MDKKQESEKVSGLTYLFSADGTLSGVSYEGALDAATHAKIKAAVLAAREIGKGR